MKKKEEITDRIRKQTFALRFVPLTHKNKVELVKATTAAAAYVDADQVTRTRTTTGTTAMGGGQFQCKIEQTVSCTGELSEQPKPAHNAARHNITQHWTTHRTTLDYTTRHWQAIVLHSSF